MAIHHSYTYMYDHTSFIYIHVCPDIIRMHNMHGTTQEHSTKTEMIRKFTLLDMIWKKQIHEYVQKPASQMSVFSPASSPRSEHTHKLFYKMYEKPWNQAMPCSRHIKTERWNNFRCAHLPMRLPMQHTRPRHAAYTSK